MGGLPGLLPFGINQVVSWSADSTVKLWDLNSNKCLSVLDQHTSAVIGVCILEKIHLLSWSEDGVLILWNLLTGQCLSKMEGHLGCIQGVEILDDGRVISFSSDRTLRIWELESGACLHVLHGHKDDIKGVKIFPNNFAVSWAIRQDGVLRLWNLDVGKPIRTFEHHRNWVGGVCLTSDNCFLSWAGGEICYWHLEDESPLKVQNVRSGGNIKSVELLSENKVLIQNDRCVYQWDLNTDSFFCMRNSDNSFIEISDIDLPSITSKPRWFGIKPYVFQMMNNGVCLVVNNNTQVEVLHPWVGNKRVNLNDCSAEIPYEV